MPPSPGQPEAQRAQMGTAWLVPLSTLSKHLTKVAQVQDGLFGSGLPLSAP